jgi:hypothetical protein
MHKTKKQKTQHAAKELVELLTTDEPKQEEEEEIPDEEISKEMLALARRKTSLFKKKESVINEVIWQKLMKNFVLIINYDYNRMV